MPASITLTVSHLASSTSFFLACLQPLNYIYRGRVNDTIGFGHPDAAPDFWITQSIPGVPPGPAHVAFPATSRALVHEFYLAAMKAGARNHAEPALRDIASGYFSGAVIDFDGNSIEAVFRADLMESGRAASNDAKSVVSMTKSVAKSRAPTVISSASKAKSVASAQTPKSTASKAPSQAVSRAMSGAPSNPPSVAGTRAPPQTAPAAPSAGDSLSGFLQEAKGTINVARELVSKVAGPSQPSKGSPPESHTASDAIVGTLLGVAAGAALHYALTSRSKDNEEPPSRPPTPPTYKPAFARSETAPSYSQQRMHYYYDYERPRAIEAPPMSTASRNARGQRLIEMVDNEPTLSEYVPSAVQSRHRRSSFSGAMPVVSTVSSSRTVATQRTARPKGQEAPPTAYRAPTAITQPDTHTHVSRQSMSSRSRAKSLTRTPSTRDEGYASATEGRSRVPRHSSKHSHRHRSHHKHRDSDDHDDSQSTSSKSEALLTPRRSSTVKKSSHGHNDDKKHDNTGEKQKSVISTVVTAIKNHVEPPRPTDPGPGKVTNTAAAAATTRRPPSPTPSQIKLPPSRAATWTGSVHDYDSKDRGDRHRGDRDRDNLSTHSKSNKTVIGKLTRRQLEKLEDGGRRVDGSGITKSVISKVKEVDRLGVSGREVRPEDSVSQI